MALRRLAPRIPAHEFGAVVDHAVDSPGLAVATPESAAWLSLVAYVRHVFTDYDELLQQDYDQESAPPFRGRRDRCRPARLGRATALERRRLNRGDCRLSSVQPCARRSAFCQAKAVSPKTLAHVTGIHI
jgi:hypothetical protein